MLDNNESMQPKLVIRPSVGMLIWIGILLSFPFILGIATFIFPGGKLYGSILVIGASIFWLWEATVRIILYDTHLEKRILGRVRWTQPTKTLNISHGLGGQVPFIPAIIIYDRVTNKKTGEILKTMFKKSDLDLLENELSEYKF